MPQTLEFEWLSSIQMYFSETRLTALIPFTLAVPAIQGMTRSAGPEGPFMLYIIEKQEAQFLRGIGWRTCP